MKPLLSVIVPVYGVESYLPKCLDSICGQSYENLEILLVDDGSPDSCGRICDEYAARDPRIRVLHQENGGQAVARNRALDLAKGDYITFVDSDDWLEPDAYEAMLDMARRTEAEIVSAGRYNVSQKTGERTLGLCPRGEEIISPEEMLRRMFTWQGCDSSPCDKLFAAQVFSGLRFPEKSGQEDIGLLYRLVLASRRVAMLPKPVYNYLQRSGSTSYGAVTEKLFQGPGYAGELYAYIRQQAPAAEQEARYLLVWNLARTLILLDQADNETRERFRTPMRKCRRALRGHLGFILTAPWFGKQERLTDLLTALGCYRSLRRLVHRGR